MGGEWFGYAILAVIVIVLTLYMGEAIMSLFWSEKIVDDAKENDHAEE